MVVFPDFEEMLQCLNAVKAKYLVVGAHAVGFYTEPRYTKDLDILPQDKIDLKKTFQQSSQEKLGARRKK